MVGDSANIGLCGTGGARRFAAGPLRVSVADGRLRVAWSDVEVIREIDCPIRDADWRTLAVTETFWEARTMPRGFRLIRRFETADGGIAGELRVEGDGDADGAELTARLELTALRASEVNRAGFVVLHPIAGVAGAPLKVRHPEGGVEATRFPERVSPSQPVFDIAGLRHRTRNVEVSLDFEGEVFEMEDQRNWTDASFKTYCRPLAKPRPYTIDAGETVVQKIRLNVRPTSGGTDRASVGLGVTCVMPRVLLAHEAGLSDAPPCAALGRVPVDGLLLRVDAREPFPASLPIKAPVTLEIVTDDDARADIEAVAAACRAAGVAPRRVVALPRRYLASHQPDGPWPGGPAPADLLASLRAAFPDAAVGGGMLTNFTEFNRHPPDPEAVDFVTFGTTAIVHAADDRAVLETLEALPEVFASASALAPGRALHLGLVSIGMRSNPYGAAVAPNPERRRVAMAMDDPRQRTDFAAAWAVGAAAAAARGGVASYAPAMVSGPLGPGDDEAWPLLDVVAALAALGGSTVEVTGGPSSGVIRIFGKGRDGISGIAANLGPGRARVTAPSGAETELAPLGVATFREGRS